ncbi:hypothetical protein D3C81_1978450 [compost metagenome]
MQRQRLIAPILQYAYNGRQRGHFYNSLLIRNRSVAQEIHGHPRQRFEFNICRIAAKFWREQKSGWRAALLLMNEFQRVLAKLIAWQAGRIKKGLIHHKHDIRLL